MTRLLLSGCLLLLLIILATLTYPDIRDYFDRQNHMVLQTSVERPSAQPLPSTPASTHTQTETKPAGKGVNWAVPFTPQAPTANWDAAHEEACEEASALMVLKYFAGQDFATPQDAEEGIVDLLTKNEQTLGYPVDQTAAQVADLLHLMNPGLTTELLENPTEDDIKVALEEGKLIIVPAAGRRLGNPYFQDPGPPYHMLVIRGYTADGYAITNDPGTKRGKEYVYDWDTLLAAVHDWNGTVENIESGKRVVLVVGN